ncbi:Aste57867_21418 [Aphanomyces stellatus]|uniref:Aste57867_21418 protein n=1 Tax=Aphanomyces stellatus TaxID=120398 RepID=A0A485LIR3_9STRA|nr:hypothetical protein As57867_021349 [Aphanomyces stellatus]VFT98089.1 Aste57867_21418 [Aphanomyces stellatus]
MTSTTLSLSPIIDLTSDAIVLVSSSSPTPSPAKRMVQSPPAAKRRHAKLVKASPPKKVGSKRPNVLLAKKWDEQQDVTGWWVSEKLDGVRGYWNGAHFVSRLGNIFHAPAFFTAHLPTDHHLDGELFMGRNLFEQTVGIVKRHDGGDLWKKLTFMVFDVPSLKQTTFEARQAFLRTCVADCPYAKAVEQRVCRSNAALWESLNDVEALGAEGLMLRQPRSAYVGGRSNTLLKVKSFSDDEAIVVGYEDGKGKYEGLVGSLKVRNRGGVRFSVGSGLTDSHRRKPPTVGSMITYRFQELTAAGVPRFPTFVGVAIDKAWDESK